MKPLAHRHALLLQNVGDQLVVYDQERKRLHVLSRSAALVWEHCDGQRDVAQLAEIIGRELGAAVDDEVVLLALQQLGEADLLKTSPEPTSRMDGVTRREMMSRALSGLAAGVLMPVVTSCGSIVDSTMGLATRSDIGITESTTPLPTTIGTTPLGTTPLGTTPLGTTPLGTTPLGTTPLGTTPLGTTPLPTTTLPPATTTSTTTVATTTTSPPRKVQMCHNGRTIMVDEHAVPAHLAHGDTIGPCPG